MSDHPHETIDTSRPHPARMYDYYLGGKDWFEADRRMAEEVVSGFPAVRTWARANRQFMHRATRALAREEGVRQFLDLGTGIPTKPNLHQIAQAEAPESRVVYVDNDPLVIEYADALLRGTPQGRTTYLEADVRTHDLLADPSVTDTLDLDRPVALSLVALMHFMPDEEEPYELVRRLLDRLAPGSFLVLSHATADFGDNARQVREMYEGRGISGRLRSGEEVAGFFDGLDLLDPGLVVGHRWRPDEEPRLPDAEVGFYAGVARKP
ncbi:SAM-dependent methyltransferase [Streptomyces xiaopingdaonensis]|uniref:SAM-dependent methyltransferase n=1 Tax=Streptomyces xiaopingdaonensis TaxID=1565415 RepID=UPI0002E775A8|nr:SAM-dependent methyltransferase [Streptomyces xiaopingdaonensis]